MPKLLSFLFLAFGLDCHTSPIHASGVTLRVTWTSHVLDDAINRSRVVYLASYFSFV